MIVTIKKATTVNWMWYSGFAQNLIKQDLKRKAPYKNGKNKFTSWNSTHFQTTTSIKTLTFVNIITLLYEQTKKSGTKKKYEDSSSERRFFVFIFRLDEDTSSLFFA